MFYLTQSNESGVRPGLRSAYRLGGWGIGLLSLLWLTGVSGAQEVSSSGLDLSGPDLSDLDQAFESILTPSVTGVQRAPEVFHLGRATVRTQPGARLFTFSAAGKHVGYWLDGKAQLEYRIEDRMSVPTARRNLKEADGIEVKEADGLTTLSTPVDGAAFWSWDLRLGSDTWESVADQALPPWLVEMVADQYSSNPARDLLRSEHHGDSGFIWSVFRAKGEDLVLDVDPRPVAQAESLGRLLKPLPRIAGSSAGRRSVEWLVQQPIDRAWWQPEAVQFAAIEVDLKVRNKQKDHLQVTTRMRLLCQREGLRLLVFRHLSERRNAAGKWRDYEIKSLTIDGRPVSYRHRDHELLVVLPRAVKKGEALVLEQVAEGEVLVRPEGDNYWRLGSEPWYPKPWLGGLEWAEYRIDAEVQGPYVVFAAGEVLRSSSDADHSRVQTHLKGPMRSAMVIAGKYRTLSQDEDGRRVHISSYGKVKETSAERLWQVIYSVQDCLGNWLGEPYPFQDLQVVEVRQWGFGQAPPGMIFITREAFLTKAAAQQGDLTRTLASIFSKGINERVAHEVAHAWFPHVAKVTRSEENWLSESFADYSSAFCLQQRMSNKKKAKELFDRQFQEWKNHSKDAGDAAGVYLANHLAATPDNRRIRQQLLYGRGPLVLHAIRQRLQEKHGDEEGDRLFLTWIRSYIRNFTFKSAETRYLIQILNQVSGEDWQPFFERFIYGAESPPVK